jgi:hypothetical protein
MNFSKIRALIGSHWIKHSGMTMSEVGRRFERSSVAVSKQIAHLADGTNSYFDVHVLEKINEAIQKSVISFQ